MIIQVTARSGIAELIEIAAIRGFVQKNNETLSSGKPKCCIADKVMEVFNCHQTAIMRHVGHLNQWHMMEVLKIMIE